MLHMPRLAWRLGAQLGFRKQVVYEAMHMEDRAFVELFST